MEHTLELRGAITSSTSVSALKAAIWCYDEANDAESRSKSGKMAHLVAIDNSADKFLSLFAYSLPDTPLPVLEPKETYHYGIDEHVAHLLWIDSAVLGAIVTKDGVDLTSNQGYGSALKLFDSELKLLGKWPLVAYSSSQVIGFQSLGDECWIIFKDHSLLSFKMNRDALWKDETDEVDEDVHRSDLDASRMFSRVKRWSAGGQSELRGMAVFGHSKYHKLAGTLLVGIGSKPFLAVYKSDPLYLLPSFAASSEDSSPRRSAWEQNRGSTVRQLASVVASGIRKRLGGGEEGEDRGYGNVSAYRGEVGKKRPAVELEKVCALHDPGRKGTSLSHADPSERYCAAVDAFGRVSLLDVRHSFRIVHVFKGLRDAQVGWLTASEQSVSRAATALYLVLLAPQRKRLQIWRMPTGPFVDSIALGSADSSREVAEKFQLVSGSNRAQGLAWTFVLSWRPVASVMIRRVGLTPRAVEKLVRHVRRNARQSEGLLLYQLEKLLSEVESSAGKAGPVKTQSLVDLVKQAQSPALLHRALSTLDQHLNLPISMQQASTKAAIQVVSHCKDQFISTVHASTKREAAVAKLDQFTSLLQRRLALIEAYEALNSAVQVSPEDTGSYQHLPESAADWRGVQAWLPSKARASLLARSPPARITLHGLLAAQALLFGQSRVGLSARRGYGVGVAMLVYAPLLEDVFVLNAVEHMEGLLGLNDMSEEKLRLFETAWMRSKIQTLLLHAPTAHPALRWLRNVDAKNRGVVAHTLIPRLSSSVQLVHVRQLCDLLVHVHTKEEEENADEPNHHLRGLRDQVTQVLVLRRLLGDVDGLSVAAIGSSAGEMCLANVVARKQLEENPAPQRFRDLLAWRERFRVVPKRGLNEEDVRDGRFASEDAVGLIAGWTGKKWAELASNMCCHRSLLLLGLWEEGFRSSTVVFSAAVENITTIDAPLLRAGMCLDVWNRYAHELACNATRLCERSQVDRHEKSQAVRMLKSLMRLLDILRDVVKSESSSGGGAPSVDLGNVVEVDGVGRALSVWPSVASDRSGVIIKRYDDVKQQIGHESVRVQFTLLQALCAVFEQLAEGHPVRTSFSPDKLFTAKCEWFTPEALFVKEAEIGSDESCLELRRKVVFALLASQPGRAERAYSLGEAFGLDPEEIKCEHVQVLYSCAMDERGEEALLQVLDKKHVLTGLLGIARSRLASVLKRLERNPLERNRLALVSADARRWILAAHLDTTEKDSHRKSEPTVTQTLVMLRQLEQTASTMKQPSIRKHFEELLRTAEILEQPPPSS